jgi:outer membrane protein OmpA-like peptidoglycan-associated protein
VALIGSLLVVSNLSGCATTSAKRKAALVGAGIGAYVGGGAGYALSDDEDRARGTIIGALFGAMVGNALGQASRQSPSEEIPLPPAPEEKTAPVVPAESPEAPKKPGADVVARTSPEPLATATEIPPSEKHAPDAKTVEAGDRVSALFKRVHFDFDKWNIKPQFMPMLDEIAEILLATPSLRLTITGHADAISTESYNQRLSERRAAEVRSYLTKRGVQASRLMTEGHGELEPLAPNTRPDGRDNPEGRALNRRAEFGEDTGKP